MQGVVLVLVVIVILVNLVVDVLTFLDPRVAEHDRRERPRRSRTGASRWMRRDLRAVLSLAILLLLLSRSCAGCRAVFADRPERRRNAAAAERRTICSAPTISAATCLSRLIWGAPNCLYATFLAVGVGIVLGVPSGC